MIIKFTVRVHLYYFVSRVDDDSDNPIMNISAHSLGISDQNLLVSVIVFMHQMKIEKIWSKYVYGCHLYRVKLGKNN